MNSFVFDVLIFFLVFFCWVVSFFDYTHPVILFFLIFYSFRFRAFKSSTIYIYIIIYSRNFDLEIFHSVPL